MHVGDEQVEASVSVEVERLHAHRAPGRLGKVLPCRVVKSFAGRVAPQMILALHVEDIEVGPTVVVHVDDRRVPAPRSEEHTSELQSHSDLVCRLLLEKKKTK